ncbi:hypothetical protein SAMN02745673_02556 [Marinactinospora thermotolerans DSM 45154]|uniref:Uncharacterized protein n=1 Tax=Marinactinospora thermotolerans DSM 45154 TaxID=1122192 RepID=A0A1T4R6C9_9ACTN|nr:hypothetical protein [Marinactinospora thermotolerans]SKA11453.1 hypothetical protein SAMN02745673_02556 [Marinactinospora thermotolerans DSM 45154]
MSEPLGHEPRTTHDRDVAPLLRDDEEQEGQRPREEGRQVTGTGVPTDIPREDDDERARSRDEGPSTGGSAHDHVPRP